MNIHSDFQWMMSSDNNKKLVVMRGVSSSGKSYRAKEIAGLDGDIYAADDFFEAGSDGTPEGYQKNWRGDLLRTAHNLCMKNVRMYMQRQGLLVVVDNTNTTVREIMPYVDMAIQYQYKIEIAEPTSPWWINDISPYLNDKVKNRKHLEQMAQLLCEKNKKTHLVPYEAIKKSLFRYHVNITPEQLLSKVKNVNSGCDSDCPLGG